MSIPAHSTKVHLSLPINGLLTQADASTLEEDLSSLEGLTFVSVDFFSETANLEYDPSQLDLVDVEITINQCGFCMPVNEAIFEIHDRLLPTQAREIEQRIEKLPGVLLASVNTRENCARVQYIDQVLTKEQIRQELL